MQLTTSALPPAKRGSKLNLVDAAGKTVGFYWLDDAATATLEAERPSPQAVVTVAIVFSDHPKETA